MAKTYYRNSEPTTVNTGDIAVYPKGNQLCIKNDTGVETCFIGAGSLPTQFASANIVTGNILEFRKSDNSLIDSVDLTAFLDNINLSRITSATAVAGNQIELRRDDASVAATLDLSAYVETVTSLSLAANILTYTDENGTANTIDLSIYLDDTNLARLVSGTIDPLTGIATFSRDDASTFTIDFSSLTLTQSVYEAYEVGTTTLPSANGTATNALLIPMNTEESPQTGFSTAGGIITVATAGRYKISYTMSADSTDGDRATSRSALYINGFELVRSRANAYHRSTAAGEGSATRSVAITLTANSTVELRSLIFGDNVDTLDQGSSIIIERIG